MFPIAELISPEFAILPPADDRFISPTACSVGKFVAVLVVVLDAGTPFVKEDPALMLSAPELLIVPKLLKLLAAFSVKSSEEFV